MTRRGELTDDIWERIAPLLPENGRRGKQWKDHREVVNGILWKIRTGAPWRDLPSRYGPWQTCYDRFARWRRDGTWDRLLAHAQMKADAASEVVWEVSVDSTISAAAQTTRSPHRRPRVQLPEVPEAAATTRHSAHHPGAARQTRAACRVPRQTAELRPGRLPDAQRGGAVREPAKTVAGDRHTLREAGEQLPGDGGHRSAYGLADVVNH